MAVTFMAEVFYLRGKGEEGRYEVINAMGEGQKITFEKGRGVDIS